MAGTGTAGLHELLTEVLHGCPRPTGGWHPGESHIDALFADFNAAVATLERVPAALEALARELEEDLSARETRAEGALAAAFERLAQMPRPGGMHPYLDAIAPALDALGASLRAIARAEGAAAVFEAQRRVATDRTEGPHVDEETLDRIQAGGG